MFLIWTVWIVTAFCLFLIFRPLPKDSPFMSVEGLWEQIDRLVWLIPIIVVWVVYLAAT